MDGYAARHIHEVPWIALSAGHRRLFFPWSICGSRVDQQRSRSMALRARSIAPELFGSFLFHFWGDPWWPFSRVGTFEGFACVSTYENISSKSSMVYIRVSLYKRQGERKVQLDRYHKQSNKNIKATPIRMTVNPSSPSLSDRANSTHCVCVVPQTSSEVWELTRLRHHIWHQFTLPETLGCHQTPKSAFW